MLERISKICCGMRATMHLLIKLNILLHLSPGIFGAIELNCGATSPSLPQSVTCSCKNTDGNGVEWWNNGTLASICFFSVNCAPYPSGYTFSLNQTEQMFNLTVNPYSYRDCQQFTCKDFSNITIQQSQKPSTIEFDSTMPSAIAEPVSNHTSGDISITTSCISGYSDLIVNWYIIGDGTKKSYIPDQDNVIKRINTTTCINCNSESAATITIGFRHEEAVDNDALTGHFRLELHHPNYPLDALVRDTSNVYKVADVHLTDNEVYNQCFLTLCLRERNCIIILNAIIVIIGIIGCVAAVFYCKNMIYMKGQRRVSATGYSVLTQTEEQFPTNTDWHIKLRTLEEQIQIFKTNEYAKEVIYKQEKLRNAIYEYKVYSNTVSDVPDDGTESITCAFTADESTITFQRGTVDGKKDDVACQINGNLEHIKCIIKEVEILSEAIRDGKEMLYTRIAIYRGVEVIVKILEDMQSLLRPEENHMLTQTEGTVPNKTDWSSKLYVLKKLILEYNQERNQEPNEVTDILKKIIKAINEYHISSNTDRPHVNEVSDDSTAAVRCSPASIACQTNWSWDSTKLIIKDFDTISKAIRECIQALKTQTALHKEVEPLVETMGDMQKLFFEEEKQDKLAQTEETIQNKTDLHSKLNELEKRIQNFESNLDAKKVTDRLRKVKMAIDKHHVHNNSELDTVPDGNADRKCATTFEESTTHISVACQTIESWKTIQRKKCIFKDLDELCKVIKKCIETLKTQTALNRNLETIVGTMEDIQKLSCNGNGSMTTSDQGGSKEVVYTFTTFIAE